MHHRHCIAAAVKRGRLARQTSQSRPYRRGAALGACQEYGAGPEAQGGGEPPRKTALLGLGLQTAASPRAETEA
jgi:hypothetical protein